MKNVDFLLKEEECVSYFVQGNLWRSVPSQNAGKIMLPLLGHFNDFETSASLSGHSNKLGALYVAVPCLPPKFQAKLQSIFLACIFRSED